MKKRRVTEAAVAPPSEKRRKTEPAKDKEFVEAAASLTAEEVDYVRKHARQRKEVNPGPAPPESDTPPKSKIPPAEAKAPPTEKKMPVPAKGKTAPPEERQPRPAGHRSRGVARGKRAQIEHPWPEVGTVLEADYFGTHYTAEVIEAPAGRKLKSGKTVRVTSGPAAGTEHASMSGAMEAATEQQRNEQALGRKGCLSGWDFWRWPGKDGGKH